jgi:tetratricopeptide (TPR) repeat protein
MNSRRKGGANQNRRWCVQPAILREPDEGLEGLHVLQEIDGPVGVRLWAALRDVTLWAGAPPAVRGALFAPAAAARRLEALADTAAEPALEVPLVALAGVVGQPREVRPQTVALMCRRIAAWAEAHGALGTAVAFAQAAALARPRDADAACDVGRLTMAWGSTARAETWFRRTVGVARRARDLDAHARAFVGLGTLLARRGAREAARRHFGKALKAARRGGHPYARAAALHGLFRIALEAGEWEEAERLSAAALRAHRRTRGVLPALLLDVATMHVARQRPQQAAAVLHKLLAMRTEERERVPALAMLAHAAALGGDARAYEEAWSAAWTSATAASPDQHAAALLDLARAAAAREDWLRLDQALRLVPGHRLDAAGQRAAEALARALAAARSPS